jgi:hypothetical protein
LATHHANDERLRRRENSSGRAATRATPSPKTRKTFIDSAERLINNSYISRAAKNALAGGSCESKRLLTRLALRISLIAARLIE